MRRTYKDRMEHLDAYPDCFGRTFGGQWIIWSDGAQDKLHAGRFNTIREAIDFHMDNNEN